jgi:uncharacterized membrane protein YraQ (UPF0718 family)
MAMTKNELKIKAAEFLLDIAKLIVAGVVLSSIFDAAVSRTMAIFWGIASTLMFSFAGFYLYFKTLKN